RRQRKLGRDDIIRQGARTEEDFHFLRPHQLTKQTLDEREIFFELLRAMRNRELVQRGADFLPDADRAGEETDRVQRAVRRGGNIQQRRGDLLEFLHGQIHGLELGVLRAYQGSERDEAEMFVEFLLANRAGNDGEIIL